MKKKEKVAFIIYLWFSFSVSQLKVLGQIVVDERPKMLYYEMTHERITNFWKMKDMRDVTHRNKFLMGRNRVSGNISYNTGRIMIDDGHEKQDEIRSALGFFTRIRFFEEFSVNTTFYKDFNSRAAARWTSNYTYSIARYSWKPNTFSFGYENYTNNRYTDDLKTFGNKFQEGYYFISFNQNLSDSLTKKISFDNSTSLRFTYFARYAIKYRIADEKLRGGLVTGKPTFGLSCRFTIVWKIYAEGALYFYPISKKAPWDPDYSYGFGYFDWRSFRLSLSYGNWAVNRFPWNKTYYPNYGFLDGNFKIAANWIW